MNRFGVVADEFANRAPHSGAVLVAEAVISLDELELALPDDWDPFSDLRASCANDVVDDLLNKAVIDTLDILCAIDSNTRRLKTPPSRLLQKHAILGGCPVWEADVPEVKFVCGATGQPKWFVKKIVMNEADGSYFEVETDGMSAKSKRPLTNAYRKRYFDPGMVEVGTDRGEFEIWRACLHILVDELDCKLESRAPIRSSRPLRPFAG